MQCVNFVGKLDVAVELDGTPSAVTAGRSRSASSRTAAERFCFNLVPIAGQRLFVRLDDHQALVAVDNDQFAAGDVGQERAGADDRRYLQGLGDDRGVAARPADLRDEAADEIGGRDWRFRWASGCGPARAPAK